VNREKKNSTNENSYNNDTKTGRVIAKGEYIKKIKKSNN